jgi:type I restriction enzyme M protein
MGFNQGHEFGFYETPEWVADLIACNYSPKQRTQIIDLGAGHGSLLKSFSKVHPKAYRTALEINKAHLDELQPISHELFNIDLLRGGIPSGVFKKGFQRTIISNPPFGKLALEQDVKDSLIMNGLIDPCTASKNARLEAYFLSLALSSTKSGSAIAFIVSANLLYQNLWRTLRNTLITKHKLDKIILLPRDAYRGAEVESAVIFLSPYRGISKTINVLDYRESFPQERACQVDKFVNCFFSELHPGSSQHQLGGILQLIYRGRSCSKELKTNNISHLHSSDINTFHKAKIRLPLNSRNHGSREKMAEAGDILIARVGTRCLGSSVMIESGKSIISDSVISVRVPCDQREKIFRELTSDAGREWLRSTARGSCAKIITYDSIQRFPIGAI